MKIRTDFVTNSSSYNTSEIVIENPVLLEILQKYKDMGLFGQNTPVFGIGEYVTYFDQDLGINYPGKTRTPAFFFSEEQSDVWINCLGLVTDDIYPEKLDQVLEKIISVMESGQKYLDEHILSQLKEELNQREDEINHTFSRVNWEFSGHGDEGSWYIRFDFDPENGEKILYQFDGDDRDNPSEIFIDNPVLLEILQKYKGMGLFMKSHGMFGIGEFDSSDEYWEDSRNSDLTGIPAFHFFESDFFFSDLDKPVVSPTSLDEVLYGITSLLDEDADHMEASILAQLKDELLQRADEIRHAYSRVYWSLEQREIERKNFSYDPIQGESFYEGDRHDEETGEEG